MNTNEERNCADVVDDLIRIAERRLESINNLSPYNADIASAWAAESCATSLLAIARIMREELR